MMCSRDWEVISWSAVTATMHIICGTISPALSSRLVGHRYNICELLGSVTLPDHVENLFLISGGSTSGTGNGLNNIIAAGSVGATLDGGGGDDVLVGGSGADLFKITAGNGSDAVVNFKPSSDVIKLQGYGISSFDQLMALGEQVGSDVQFAFANGEKLVVRDVSLSI